MDGPVKDEIAREQELIAVSERIKKLTGTETDDSDPIVFIPEDEWNGRKDKEFASTIFDGFMTTIANISDNALELIGREIKANHPDRAEQYEIAFREMEPIAAVFKALAEDRLPLSRDAEKEVEQRNIGDIISCYKSPAFNLDGIGIRRVDILIRPERFIRPLKLRPDHPNRVQPELSENGSAKQRMTIRTYPENVVDDYIEVRFDAESVVEYGEMTYDIEFGKFDETRRRTKLDRFKYLKFDPGVGQRYGHHFSTGITPNNLQDQGTSFAEVLRALDAKIADGVV